MLLKKLYIYIYRPIRLLSFYNVFISTNIWTNQKKPEVYFHFWDAGTRMAGQHELPPSKFHEWMVILKRTTARKVLKWRFCKNLILFTLELHCFDSQDAYNNFNIYCSNPVIHFKLNGDSPLYVCMSLHIWYQLLSYYSCWMNYISRASDALGNYWITDICILNKKRSFQHANNRYDIIITCKIHKTMLRIVECESNSTYTVLKTEQFITLPHFTTLTGNSRLQI